MKKREDYDNIYDNKVYDDVHKDDRHKYNDRYNDKDNNKMYDNMYDNSPFNYPTPVEHIQIHNHLEKYNKLINETYLTDMNIRKYNIYKMIYSYSKNVENQNKIIFEKLEELQNITNNFTELNKKNIYFTYQNNYELQLDKNDDLSYYAFNPINFENLKTNYISLKQKLNYFNDIINIYSKKNT